MQEEAAQQDTRGAAGGKEAAAPLPPRRPVKGFLRVSKQVQLSGTSARKSKLSAAGEDGESTTEQQGEYYSTASGASAEGDFVSPAPKTSGPPARSSTSEGALEGAPASTTRVPGKPVSATTRSTPSARSGPKITKAKSAPPGHEHDSNSINTKSPPDRRTDREEQSGALSSWIPRAHFWLETYFDSSTLGKMDAFAATVQQIVRGDQFFDEGWGNLENVSRMMCRIHFQAQRALLLRAVFADNVMGRSLTFDERNEFFRLVRGGLMIEQAINGDKIKTCLKTSTISKGDEDEDNSSRHLRAILGRDGGCFDRMVGGELFEKLQNVAFGRVWRRIAQHDFDLQDELPAEQACFCAWKYYWARNQIQIPQRPKSADLPAYLAKSHQPPFRFDFGSDTWEETFKSDDLFLLKEVRRIDREVKTFVLPEDEMTNANGATSAPTSISMEEFLKGADAVAGNERQKSGAGNPKPSGGPTPPPGASRRTPARSVAAEVMQPPPENKGIFGRHDEEAEKSSAPRSVGSRLEREYGAEFEVTEYEFLSPIADFLPEETKKGYFLFVRWIRDLEEPPSPESSERDGEARSAAGGSSRSKTKPRPSPTSEVDVKARTSSSTTGGERRIPARARTSGFTKKQAEEKVDQESTSTAQVHRVGVRPSGTYLRSRRNFSTESEGPANDSEEQPPSVFGSKSLVLILPHTGESTMRESYRLPVAMKIADRDTVCVLPLAPMHGKRSTERMVRHYTRTVEHACHLFSGLSIEAAAIAYTYCNSVTFRNFLAKKVDSGLVCRGSESRSKQSKAKKPPNRTSLDVNLWKRDAEEQVEGGEQHQVVPACSSTEQRNSFHLARPGMCLFSGFSLGGGCALGAAVALLLLDPWIAIRIGSYCGPHSPTVLVDGHLQRECNLQALMCDGLTRVAAPGAVVFPPDVAGVEQPRGPPRSHSSQLPAGAAGAAVGVKDRTKSVIMNDKEATSAVTAGSTSTARTILGQDQLPEQVVASESDPPSTPARARFDPAARPPAIPRGHNSTPKNSNKQQKKFVPTYDGRPITTQLISSPERAGAVFRRFLRHHQSIDLWRPYLLPLNESHRCAALVVGCFDDEFVPKQSVQDYYEVVEQIAWKSKIEWHSGGHATAVVLRCEKEMTHILRRILSEEFG